MRKRIMCVLNMYYLSSKGVLKVESLVITLLIHKLLYGGNGNHTDTPLFNCWRAVHAVGWFRLGSPVNDIHQHRTLL